MDVKACDNCKKLNTENTKPFARISKHGYQDAARGVYDNGAIGSIGVYPDKDSDKGPFWKNTKVLCSDCTMSHVTELVKELFSVENLAKLSEHP
jgi:hypothetical protein